MAGCARHARVTSLGDGPPDNAGARTGPPVGMDTSNHHVSWRYLTFERWDYPGLNTDDFSTMYAFPWKTQLQIYEKEGWLIDSVTFKTNEAFGRPKEIRVAIIKLKHLTNTNPDGLALQVLVPSKHVNSDGTVPAFLVLSNGGPQSIRFSMLANPIRGVGPGGSFDVTWMPGFHFSDGWSSDEFSQSIRTLLPGQHVQWPFEMVVGTNQTLHVTAHYDAYNDSYPDADLWEGQVNSQLFTIQFNR